jgi:hypothetical protein
MQPKRSTGELVKGVADDVTLLVRKEVELARTELVDAIMPKLKGAGLVAAAVLAVLPGLLFLLAALALWLPMSASAGFGLVGAALFALAGAAIWIGLRLLRRRRTSRALESIKEDVEWARSRLKR